MYQVKMLNRRCLVVCRVQLVDSRDPGRRQVTGMRKRLPVGVAELRNNHGTDHGRDATSQGLDTVHARLAVGAASTVAVFLLEAHQANRK